MDLHWGTVPITPLFCPARCASLGRFSPGFPCSLDCTITLTTVQSACDESVMAYTHSSKGPQARMNYNLAIFLEPCVGPQGGLPCIQRFCISEPLTASCRMDSTLSPTRARRQISGHLILELRRFNNIYSGTVFARRRPCMFVETEARPKGSPLPLSQSPPRRWVPVGCRKLPYRPERNRSSRDLTWNHSYYCHQLRQYRHSPSSLRCPLLPLLQLPRAQTLIGTKIQSTRLRRFGMSIFGRKPTRVPSSSPRAMQRIKAK